jgi:hypothetical protein
MRARSRSAEPADVGGIDDDAAGEAVSEAASAVVDEDEQEAGEE